MKKGEPRKNNFSGEAILVLQEWEENTRRYILFLLQKIKSHKQTGKGIVLVFALSLLLALYVYNKTGDGEVWLIGMFLWVPLLFWGLFNQLSVGCVEAEINFLEQSLGEIRGIP